MQPLKSEFLGDRQEVKSVNVDGDRVVVNLLTQDADDALCCPTKEVTRVYTLQPTLVQTGGDRPSKVVLPEPLPQPTSKPHTIISLETTSHAVRVFRGDRGEPVINLYNKTTNALELTSAPITVQSTPKGTAYIYRGEFSLRVFESRDGSKLLEINGKLKK